MRSSDYPPCPPVFLPFGHAAQVDDEAERAVLNQIADLVVDLAAPPPPLPPATTPPEGTSVADAPVAPGGGVVGEAAGATVSSLGGDGHAGLETAVDDGDGDSIRSPSVPDADDSASDAAPDADAAAAASLPDAGGEQAVPDVSKGQGVTHGAEGAASTGGLAVARESPKRCQPQLRIALKSLPPSVDRQFLFRAVPKVS